MKIPLGMVYIKKFFLNSFFFLVFQNGPQQSSVISRNLVVSEPSAKDILIEHGTYFEKTEVKHFAGDILGYVTPWNNHGYNIARTFASKFSHISPVWLQIVRKGNLKYEIAGTHDIDLSWLEDVRKGNPSIKITVRVLFDGWTVQDYTSLFTKSKEQISLANALVDICKASNFNGVVLEVWTQIAGSVRSDVLVEFINLVAHKLNENNLQLILVIPPSRGSEQELFTAEQFDELSPHVSAFSLMTYDFSNAQQPGPNSPLSWVKKCVETLVPKKNDARRSQILMGLNFYGNDYSISGGGPIIGHEFINILKSYKGKLKLDGTSQENFFEVR